MTSTGRVARLTALALATGTLVAAGAGTAGATSTQKTDFTASGGGSVIRLTINLPSQLAPVLSAAGLPQSLTQDLVLTGGNIRTADVKAVATSTLGANGNVVALSGLLNKTVVAEYGKPAPAPFTVLPAELKTALAGFGIHVAALELNSSAANPTVDGQVSHSLSTVANLRVDGVGVLDALLEQLNAQLSAILSTALGTQSASQTAALGGVTAVGSTTAKQVLGQAVSIVEALGVQQASTLAGEAKAQLEAAIDAVVAQLNALPNLLTGKITSAATDTSLLKVGLIESEQTVDRAAGVVTSTSSNKLVGVSVLGGLVTVDGLTSKAVAKLGNGISQAGADKGQNALLKVNVKDLLSAEVTNGLNVALGSPVLPTEVVTAVNGALAQITALLNGVLGATLTQTGLGEQIETPNHAASSVSAARLVVNPTLPGLGTALFDKPLVDVQFVPATADVVKANANVPPQVTTTPGKAGTQPVMARTGANFALTAPIAISLMGLAVVARRRRLAHLGE
ncbi:MAG TPA: hypothetical protein VM097_07925 [Mycobacteriales bacterium]|nr:hypothetical protein [Mycobacteriales bacterium]